MKLSALITQLKKFNDTSNNNMLVNPPRERQTDQASTVTQSAPLIMLEFDDGFSKVVTNSEAINILETLASEVHFDPLVIHGRAEANFFGLVRVYRTLSSSVGEYSDHLIDN